MSEGIFKEVATKLKSAKKSEKKSRKVDWPSRYTIAEREERFINVEVEAKQLEEAAKKEAERIQWLIDQGVDASEIQELEQIKQEVLSYRGVRDYHDRNFYYRERNAKERNLIIDEKAGKGRLCPICKQQRINSRQWVVKRKRGDQQRVLVLCKSCYQTFLQTDQQEVEKVAKKMKKLNKAGKLDEVVVEGKVVSLQTGSEFSDEEWFNLAIVMFEEDGLTLKERIEILDRIVPERICPKCNFRKTSSRFWVINKSKNKAICKLCYKKIKPDAQLEEACLIPVRLFTGQEVRYTIDPMSLTHARTKVGLKVDEFANEAGWSASYQYQLESGKYRTISEQCSEDILRVLLNYGYFTED